MPSASTPYASLDVISDWLRQRIADYVRQPVDNIDVHGDLARYGLDSVYALTLTTDIEERFSIPLEPTAMWDHPSIARLTDHIAQTLSRQAA